MRRAARVGAAVIAVAGALAASCRQPPRLGFDFERDGELDRLEWRCLTLLRLSDRHATSGEKSLEITFHPAPSDRGESYPGFSVLAFDPDWRAYRSLTFDVYNPSDEAVPLSLRIDDRAAPAAGDRHERRLILSPGQNHVSIPLADALTSGTKRALDLRRVREVMLYVANPNRRHTLFLDSLRLDP